MVRAEQANISTGYWTQGGSYPISHALCHLHCLWEAGERANLMRKQTAKLHPDLTSRNLFWSRPHSSLRYAGCWQGSGNTLGDILAPALLALHSQIWSGAPPVQLQAAKS